MAKLTLRNLAGDAIVAFDFTQEQLDDADDFFTVVDWIMANPEKSHYLTGHSEFHKLTLLCRDVRAKLWNVDVDDKHEFPFPDAGEEAVRDWVEATIEYADWEN